LAFLYVFAFTTALYVQAVFLFMLEHLSRVLYGYKYKLFRVKCKGFP
jgi:hypothetical protein